ncbi:MAG: hypothetical protein ACPHK8_02005 [Thermoplasmatota archaeon]
MKFLLVSACFALVSGCVGSDEDTREVSGLKYDQNFVVSVTNRGNQSWYFDLKGELAGSSVSSHFLVPPQETGWGEYYQAWIVHGASGNVRLSAGNAEKEFDLLFSCGQDARLEIEITTDNEWFADIVYPPPFRC